MHFLSWFQIPNTSIAHSFHRELFTITNRSIFINRLPTTAEQIICNDSFPWWISPLFQFANYVCEQSWIFQIDFFFPPKPFSIPCNFWEQLYILKELQALHPCLAKASHQTWAIISSIPLTSTPISLLSLMVLMSCLAACVPCQDECSSHHQVSTANTSNISVCSSLGD